MEELQRVIEAEALFMDALGGEFRPTAEPDTVHSLARLVRNMLAERAGLPIEHKGEATEDITRELTWAPATVWLSSVPFEMRSFGRYGERGQGLLVPVEVSFSVQREGFGVRALKFSFYHPDLFSAEMQPNGPERSFGQGGGYLSLSAFSYGPYGDDGRLDEKSVGLHKISHCHKARELVTELAERAFC